MLAIVAAGGIVRGLAPTAAGSPFDGPLAACREDDRLTPHLAPDDWARVLLDPTYGLARDDVPDDLVPIAVASIAGRGELRAFVLQDLAALAADAGAAGAPFRVTSAFRTYDQQARTLASLEAAYGPEPARRMAARPGHSEHQLGTTIDVEGGERWLADNAWAYGFVMSYAPTHSPWETCYQAEPWHFRYVGREDAAAVRASGLSLRAWLWTRQNGN